MKKHYEHSRMRIAYLNTHYPAMSHTFIENEIRALREQGIEVHTFSIRRPASIDLLSRHHVDAAKDTFYILDGIFSFIISTMFGFLNPVRFLSCLFFSQKISPPGMKMRFLHLIYAFESIRLALEMSRRNLKHIHVHMANNGATVTLLACTYNKQLEYSMTIHGPDEFYNVKHFYLKTKIENSRFVRCISHFCRSQIMIWNTQDKWNDYHIVHCGVDTEHFISKTNHINDKFSILSVGRLAPIKGLTILLDAVDSLIKSGVDCRLNIIGDGPMKDALLVKTNQMGLEGQVVFIGPVGQDEIIDYYKRADALVVSSFMEGVPIVLMEAMATGLPVIATNVGGITELVEDNLNGFVIPAGSSDKLFRALKMLADNRNRAIEMGIKGREKVIQEFSIANLGKQMFNLFEKYLRKQVSP
jgi:colanic acid/amylovoran biosynthesis glycosyltransferase